ncbi:O-antigen ligase family protein [Georgenia sp. Z1491]|uniref:O-antigen ligase family protein n=1 Tax=Georgenia sp. Z1491 TaxID=3416707 RepID=UPI003CE79112
MLVPRGRRQVADRYLLGAALLWVAWVLAASILAVSTAGSWVPYVVAPLVLLLGVLIGGRLVTAWERWWVAPVAVVGALAVLAADAFYANAQAAIGVQAVALGVLMLVSVLRLGFSERTPLSVISAVLLVVLGVLLASRSQAALLLAVVGAVAVVVAVLVARWRGGRVRGTRVRPRSWAWAGRVRAQRWAWAGGVIVGLAAVVVVWLGSRDLWPGLLTGRWSLSGARHTLWADALELWAQAPVVGAGPGSFVEHSALAASDPSLSEVHSSVLQVGSELGVIGVVLFLGLLAAGLAVAARGSGVSGVVGVVAWAALAVHAMIDHLYEFPPVVLLAGVVIGWAGAAGGPGGEVDRRG